MEDGSDLERAIELLQQLGLKEYEAKSFVALSRRQSGTAKDISETSEVPRTRVYDAVRVLESKGLVETQHTNPQVFRAVSIDEAVDTLQAEYLERTESLREALGSLEPTDDRPTEEVTHEVWALSDSNGIARRTQELIEGASEEVVLVVGHESVVTDQLIEQLRAARDDGVEVVVGANSGALRAEIEDDLPEVDVFVSGLTGLGESPQDDDTEISRLLLVDRETILVSSFVRTATGDQGDEHGVFGQGFDNGLVALVRRLMATGLPVEDDPGIDDP